MASFLEAGLRIFGLSTAAPVGGAPHRIVVQETPEQSSEESSSSRCDFDDDHPSDEQGLDGDLLNPKFSFKVASEPFQSDAGPGLVCGRDAYLKSVLNWSAVGYVGRRRMDQFERDVSAKSATLKNICLGAYTVDGVVEMLQNAADSAGFTALPVFLSKNRGLHLGADGAAERHQIPKTKKHSEGTDIYHAHPSKTK
jgi:hypothetical protein